MSTISAGKLIANSLVHLGDRSGELIFQTNGTTTALTLDSAQDATFAGDVNITGSLSLNGSAITSTVTELNYNDITTLGTVEASKVVTADANGDVTFPDGEKAIFGTGGDLEIYHDGADTYITENGTGDFTIKSNGTRINLAKNPFEFMGTFNVDGSVDLYYDNTKRFETTSVGADVTGELIADSYNETYAAVTSTTNATTVNCENANSFSHTLTENTTFTFSNPPASGTSYTFSIEIIQDSGASGYTVTWPSSVDWPAATAPTLTATASAKDVFVFTTRDGGTNWYGFTAGQALA